MNDDGDEAEPPEEDRATVKEEDFFNVDALYTSMRINIVGKRLVSHTERKRMNGSTTEKTLRLYA